MVNLPKKGQPAKNTNQSK